MSTILATFVYVLLIASLFVLNREPEFRTSKALWVPVAWFLIVCSREVSAWLAGFGIGQYQLNPEVSEQYLEGNPIDRLVYTGLLLFGLFILSTRWQRAHRVMRINSAVVLFFVYCGISTFWSDFPAVAMKRWIKALGDLVMVLIVLCEADRWMAVKRLLSRTAFILIPLSILLIKYYPDLGAGYNIHHWTRVLIGVTTNKNFLGVISLLFGLASEWRFLQAYRMERGKKRKRLLLAHGIVLAMVLWLLFSANSMTALSCFLMAGTLLLLVQLRPVIQRPVMKHALAATVVLFSFSTLFMGIGGSALETMGRDASLTGRTGIWDLTLRLSGNPFIGTGFESFWLGERLTEVWTVMPGIQEAHNGYLEVFLNQGWIGVVLLTTIIVTGYRNIIQAYRRDPFLSSLALAYFVVALVYNFTEAGFRMLNPIWSLFLLSVMAVPVPSQSPATAGPAVASGFEDGSTESVLVRQSEAPNSLVALCR